MFKSSKVSFRIVTAGNVLTFAVVLALGMALAGCAAIQNQEAMDLERLLAAAGFQIKLADTPEKLAHLKALAQRRLVPHNRDGKVYYVYADAAYCRCLYAGTEKAYQRYQKLALEKKITEDQRMAAEFNENASMNWGMWGPWGPWW